MFSFLLKKTLSSIKHAQSVIFIISTSVVFAAAVSMALLSLSNSFMRIMVENPRERFGADVVVNMTNVNEDILVKNLADLKSKSEVNAYSKSTFSNYENVKSLAGLTSYVNLLGLWDNSYPVVGNIAIKGTTEHPLSLLKNENDILISKELAATLKVAVGDNISYIAFDYTQIKTLHIVGLVEHYPDAGTSTVLMKGETLKKYVSYYSDVYNIAGDEKKIESMIRTGFSDEVSLTTVSEYLSGNKSSMKEITVFLKSISILGLFVGCIGIATSMSVVIERRKGEIGILKSLGYTKAQVFAMFLFEVAVIGIIGSVVGVVIGYFFGNYLKGIFQSLGMPYSFDMSFDIFAGLVSVGATIFSAVLFSIIAINKFVSIKPLTILKDLPVVLNLREKFQNILMMTVIGIVFAGLSVLITESITFGVGVVVIAGIGMWLASLFMKILLWLILRLPLRIGNIIGLAWLTLKSTYKKYALASMAIYIGLTVLCLLLALFRTTEVEYDSNAVVYAPKVNVIAYANVQRKSSLDALITNEKAITSFKVKQRTALDIANAEQIFASTLEGRDIGNTEYIRMVSGSLQLGNTVILESNASFNYKLGDSYTQSVKGQKFTLTVTGFYEISEQKRKESIEPESAPAITSSETFKSLFSDYQLIYLLSVNNESVDSVAAKINSVENTAVVDSASLLKLFNTQIDTLKQLFLSTAGLALVAGIVLIVNATSLEVISRRRVFGIYKAIGFSNKQVTRMFLFEYVIVLIITSLFALGTSSLLVWGVNTYGLKLLDITQKITYDTTSSIVVVLVSNLLIMLLLFAVSKKTLDTKPVDILRYE